MEDTLISRRILPHGEQTLAPITLVLLSVKIKLSKWCCAQLVVFKGDERLGLMKITQIRSCDWLL